MNTLGRIFALPDFLKALKAGEELTNAATWKNRQALVNALSALLIPAAAIARAYGYPVPLNDDQILQLVGIIAVLVFNIWATYATTSRVGLPSRVEPAPASGVDGSGHGDDAQQSVRLDDGDADAGVPVLTEREVLSWGNPKG